MSTKAVFVGKQIVATIVRALKKEKGLVTTVTRNNGNRNNRFVKRRPQIPFFCCAQADDALACRQFEMLCRTMSN